MPRQSAMITARAPLAAFSVMGMAWGCFAAVLPDLKAMLGVDEATLGLLLFMTPVAAIIAMLLAPAFGAALGRFALPLSVALMGAAFALPGFAASLILFPIAMMACGAATGLTDVLMNARVAQIENDRNLPLMNLCHAFYSFGYAGSAVATGIMRAAGWSPIWVMGTIAVAAILLSLAAFEREGTIEGLARPTDGSSAALGIIPILGGAIVLIAFFSENAAESWSALHVEKTLGGTPAQGAMAPALLALTMGFARIAGQGFATRVPALRLLMGGAILASMGAIGVALAPSAHIAYVGFVVMGVGASVLAPTAFSLVGRMVAPKRRARAMARATLFGYFGYFIGPPLLGFVAGTFGLRFAFVFAALVLLGVLVLAPILVRARRD